MQIKKLSGILAIAGVLALEAVLQIAGISAGQVLNPSPLPTVPGLLTTACFAC